jgi:hypothetical protein
MFATLPETLEDVDVVMTQIDNSFDGAAVRKTLCEADQRVVPLVTDEGAMSGFVWKSTYAVM